MELVDNGQHQNPVHNFGSPAHPGSRAGSATGVANNGSGSIHVTAPCLPPGLSVRKPSSACTPDHEPDHGGQRDAAARPQGEVAAVPAWSRTPGLAGAEVKARSPGTLQGPGQRA